jgi:ribosome-associated protein YbcJ (S4-like RNA binding protein)
MKGEDKIFLLQVINAVRSGGHEMAKFLLDSGNVDRILRIRNEVGEEVLDQELIKLKGVVYESH